MINDLKIVDWIDPDEDERITLADIQFASRDAADYIETLEAQLAELRKDRERLDFVIGHGAVIQPIGDPAHAYRLDWVYPDGDEPEWRMTRDYKDWRDAIDEAMSHE